MILSPNFTLDELVFSPIAARSGIHNVPNDKEIAALTQLALNILQPIRNHFMSPVTIISGFRSAPLNRAVGGAHNSQHLHGEAADISIHSIGNDVLWQYIKDHLPYDQLILEHVPKANAAKGWVHVSYVEEGRRQALSCPMSGDYVEGLVYAKA